MIRFDHGGGPIRATTSATCVCSTLGHVDLAVVGGRGPGARDVMTIVAGDWSAVMNTSGDVPVPSGRGWISFYTLSTAWIDQPGGLQHERESYSAREADAHDPRPIVLATSGGERDVGDDHCRGRVSGCVCGPLGNRSEVHRARSGLHRGQVGHRR